VAAGNEGLARSKYGSSPIPAKNPTHHRPNRGITRRRVRHLRRRPGRADRGRQRCRWRPEWIWGRERGL